ncbi:hypothetical protein RI543_003341 [Arxiozyma heterogenica]|uniref:Uncharacterized protein n=1 Tax=Arxiozyma heterogenica TaxID=278026 RepID=A0AAN7WGX0_9SACH|nr:hypothetical protein RI543_003341 [Kazachstania heterogenica]
MPVPKSTVKSLSASNSNNSSILNNHPHPNIHNYIHSKYRGHTHLHNITATSEPQNHENNNKNSIKPKDIENIENKNPISWEFQDDLLLRYLKEVKSLGWKEISKYFSNRTANACQFRWRRLKSGNLKNNHTISIDINSIDTSSLFKSINQNIPSALIDSQSKNNAADILLPHLEMMTQNVNKETRNNNNVKEKLSTHNSNDTNIYSSYTDENTNKKLFVSNTSQFINNSNNEKYNSNHNNHNNHNAINTFSTTHNDTSSNAMSIITTNETNIKNLRKSVSAVSVKSFAKPRSFSLNVARPNLNTLNNNNNSIQQQKDLNISQPENENVGFVPKIIVRSRRSSFNTINTNPSFLVQNNNILGNDISRRNSFVIRSRRPSINLSLNSAASSRRSSFHMTDDYLDTHSTNNNNSHSHSHHPNNTHGFAKWEQAEDQLLLDLINIKKLNIKEVSILLPNRSEEEIKWRFQHLAKDKYTK